MANILNINDRITCPRKGHLVAVVKRNIHPGDIIRMKDFDFEPGQENVAGQKKICSICKSVWMIQKKIHTSDGWKPNDPQLEPVNQR